MLEADLIEDKPIATTLRKIILLGGRVGSERLRQWATEELTGYTRGEGIPEYRVLPARIKMDYVIMTATYRGPSTATGSVRGQEISAHDFSQIVGTDEKNEVRLGISVDEIEALLRDAGDEREVKMVVPSEAGQLIDHHVSYTRKTMLVYRSIQTAQLYAVLGAVRTRLAELVAELRDAVPSGATLTSANRAAVERAFDVAIHGDVSVAAGGQLIINSGTATATVSPQAAEISLWVRWRRLGAFLVGAATIAAAVFGWLAIRN